MRHCVIIGSGIAGLVAAENIRATLKDNAAITMISEEEHAFYSRPGLAYLLRGDIPERQLFIRGRDELSALNVQRITGRVTAIDTSRHALVTDDGRSVRYDRLLLATGATAAPPPFPEN